MTREELIEVLEEKGYPYREKGNKIVVTHKKGIELESLETLPPGVEFRNGGYVELPSLKTLPPGVEFKNGGAVNLESLKTLPPGVEFKNEGYVYLDSLTGGYFFSWNGNIKGIDPNRLLNKMIADGLFDRR